MKKGDFVRIKDGISDPDFKGKDLSGYTGYVDSITDDSYVEIIWDADTLAKFDDHFIELCEKRNLDYKRMVLGVDEIIIMASR
jgi:hypothetical protein